MFLNLVWLLTITRSTINQNKLLIKLIQVRRILSLRNSGNTLNSNRKRLCKRKKIPRLLQKISLLPNRSNQKINRRLNQFLRKHSLFNKQLITSNKKNLNNQSLNSRQSRIFNHKENGKILWNQKKHRNSLKSTYRQKLPNAKTNSLVCMNPSALYLDHLNSTDSRKKQYFH